MRTDLQRAWCYSQSWDGDVFAWVMREKGCDFMGAVELLARREHIEMPKFQKVNEEEIKRKRAAADAFGAAAAVFQRWLIGDEKKAVTGDKEALAYVHGRGWIDETIQASMTGFSGHKSEWQVKDMIGDFNLYGFKPNSPAAVAVLGFKGDVAACAKEQGVYRDDKFDADWIDRGRIQGLMYTPGVIYA